MRLAQRLRKRANTQPGLTQGQRANARRLASNLVALNMYEAKKGFGKAKPVL